jgi:hypothetical protein
MARWTAKCWLGSANGYQDLEVQSNTAHGAREQLQRIYGAEQVINLREVREGGSSDGDASFGAIVVLGGIALAVMFWPIALAIGILYILYKIFA